jgi:hypothetical protein
MIKLLGRPTRDPTCVAPRIDAASGDQDSRPSVHRPHRSLLSLALNTHARTLPLSMATSRCRRLLPAPEPLRSRRCGALVRLDVLYIFLPLDLLLAPSLARPQPRNPSHGRLMRPLPASPGTAPCPGGSATDFTISSRCLDGLVGCDICRRCLQVFQLKGWSLEQRCPATAVDHGYVL